MEKIMTSIECDLELIRRSVAKERMAKLMAQLVCESLMDTRLFQPKIKANKSLVMKMAWRMFRTGNYASFGEALTSAWKLSKINISI